ncbi:MAG: DUF3488 and transglutaminase-like domain-containing protein [Synergistaceae bacterium]|jgi:transglutaminase-like putative cysteine protease|nr:DUF3488 and transglutaminase-like domain-containing protein [Synergistaceae bacterium]
MTGRISLKSLLSLNTAACVLVAYLACDSLISQYTKILFLAAFSAALILDVSHVGRPPRLMLNIASIAILVLSFMEIRFETIIETFAEAVMLMIAVKMFEDRRARDYVQILSMAVIAVISAAIVAVSESFLYYCFHNSFLSGLELLLASWFDKVPNADFSPSETRCLVGRSLVIWLLMLPLCFALFFLTPRAKVAMMQMSGGDAGESYVGFSDHVSLGLVRSIQQSDALAFRAEMAEIPPGQLYWRGLVLDIFTGGAWLPSRRRSPQPMSPAYGDVITQKIFMERSFNSWLFTLDTPVQVNGDGVVSVGDGIYRRSERSLQRVARRYEYTAYSEPRSFISPLSGGINRNLNLSMPENFLPRLRSLTAGLTGSRRGHEEIVAAIAAYLSPPEFEYTLDELPVSRNALEDFIFTDKRGNCEYFAAAMAVMLRMAGVPARLIAGYHGGVYNEDGGYYIVNQNNAHVWVEAWDESERVWRRCDPTPRGFGDGSGSSEQEGYSQLAMYLDLLNYRISRIFLEYDNESRSEALYRIREILSNPGQSAEGLARGVTGAVGRLRAQVAVILLVAAAAVAVYYYRKRSRITVEETLLHGFLRAMRRQGYERKPSDGLEEFVSSIKRASESDDRLFRLASEFVERFEGFYFRDVGIGREDQVLLKGLIAKIKSFRD